MNALVKANVLAISLTCILAACTAKQTGVSTKDHSDAAAINARLGTEYLRKNMLEQARFKLERALEQDDEVALAHSSYAILMSRIGKKDKARRHFKKALKLDSEDSDTLNNYALFLCDEGKIDKAMEHFKRAYSDPFYQSPEIAWANAGICVAGVGRIDEGVEFVKRSISVNPNYSIGYRHLSFLYYQSGDLKGAKKEIDNYHERFGYTIPSLQLGIQIARKSGNKSLAADYLGIMGRKFSQTPEYRQAVEDIKKKPIR